MSKIEVLILISEQQLSNYRTTHDAEDNVVAVSTEHKKENTSEE